MKGQPYGPAGLTLHEIRKVSGCPIVPYRRGIERLGHYAPANHRQDASALHR